MQTEQFFKKHSSNCSSQCTPVKPYGHVHIYFLDTESELIDYN